jgi:hypothetical protein
MKKIIQTQKEKSPSFSSPAWLLLGLINSLPGLLRLHDEQLSYVAYNSGTLGSRGLSRLEERLALPELAFKLVSDQPTTLFKIHLSEIDSVHFPFYYFSAGMHLKVNDQKYRLSFIRPNNTRTYARGFAGAREIPASVNVGQEWKKLLLPK